MRLLLIIALIIIPITSLVIANNYSSQYKNKIKIVKELKTSKDSSKLIAEVNGIQIRENDIKAIKVMSDANVSEEEILNMLIDQQLLLEEAKRQNLEPTPEEIQAAVDEARETYNKYASEKDKMDIQAVIEGLGLSEKEYWENYIPSKYKEILTAGKLRTKIRKDVEKNIKNPNDIYSKYREELNKTIKELRKKAEIKIYK